MKGVRRTTPSSYDTGDYIIIVEDSYVFDGNDISIGREVVDLGNITQEEQNALLAPPEEGTVYLAANSTDRMLRRINTTENGEIVSKGGSIE